MKEKTFLVREIQIRYKTVKRKDGISGTRIKGPEAVAKLFRDLQNETKEKLIIINLDAKHRILGFEVVAIGGLNTCRVRPIDIFVSSFLTKAYSAIILHNHPSGDCTPSPDDKVFTRKMVKTAQIIGLNLIDHIIIGDDDYFSFATDTRLIPKSFY
jgi:DNA repair protein RadC